MPFLLRHRFKILLFNLVAYLLIAPLFLGDFVAVAGNATRSLAFVLAVCLLLTGSLVLFGRRGTRKLALALALVSLVFEALASFFFPDQLGIGNSAVHVLFLGFVIVSLLRHLFDPEIVTFDTLCASLCVYLLMGLLWMNVFVILETRNPGSFVTTVHSGALESGPIGEANRVLNLLYFSFTTLTSIGFGDIVPATHAARMFAVMETLVGQSYLLIMVSRLVGLHVSQSAAP